MHPKLRCTTFAQNVQRSGGMSGNLEVAICNLKQELVEEF
jgi:hypothetical protein